jgi:hypothetical protein
MEFGSNARLRSGDRSRWSLKSGKRPARRRPRVEALETRTLLTGTWTQVANPVPNNEVAGTMLLLSDGTVLTNATPNGGSSPNWFKLTPDSTGSYANGTWSPIHDSGTGRLYYSSDVLPDGRIFVAGGEYTGANSTNTDANTGEIYDPVANTWTPIANYPENNLGDAISEVLPDGRILEGSPFSSNTHIYDPASNTWTSGPTSLNGDIFAEEGWVKLADGSILDYQIEGTQPQTGQRLVFGATDAQDQWVPAGSVPVRLDSNGGNAAIVPELGPGFLLPSGNVFWVGASGNTALYAPPTAGNPTGTWTAGPVIKDAGGTTVGAFDAPAAVEPNGKVLIAASPIDGVNFSGPSTITEYDPATNALTRVTAPGPDLSQPAFISRMLVLPSGQVLYTDGNESTVWLYNPDSSPNPAWAPTITSIKPNGGNSYTLTGTQLNGLTEGAAYGDDAQMATNYPIIKLTDSLGNVTFAKTTNWSSKWVATGNTPVTTDFTLPAGTAPGNYTLNVIADGVSSANFNFTTHHLLVNAVAPANVNKGVAIPPTVIGTLTDLLGAHPLSSYTVTLDWGDGSNQDTVGTLTTTSAPGVYSITGSHTYTQGGAFTLKITVTDPTNDVVTATASVHVLGSAVGGTGVGFTAIEGNAFTGEVAKFDNGDPLAQASDFTATIDWGDGSSPTSGVITPDSVSGFDVAGTHTYADEGSHTAVIHITGPAATSITVNAPAKVDDAPLTPTGFPFSTAEGTAFSGKLLTFTDANPASSVSEFTATIDWNDGTTPDNVSVTVVDGQYTVSGSHTYAVAGNFNVQVTINDVGGAQAVATLAVTVTDLPIRATAVSIEAVEANLFSGTVALLTDGNSLAKATDFTATIDWNDGTPVTAGTIVASPSGGFLVVGNHTYADEGVHNALIKVFDEGGSITTTLSPVNVDDAQLTATPINFTPMEGKSFTGNIAQFTDANPNATTSEFTATIDWGDGTITSGTVSAATGGGFNVSGTHTYASAANYSVNVVVDDVGGASAQNIFTITVADAPLTLNLIPPTPVEGTGVSGIMATFTDPNPFAKVADFTATIDWGDGTTDAATVTTAFGGGFNVSGTHTYEEGTYPQFKVTVIDAGGATASNTASVTVADAALSGLSVPINSTEGTSFTGVVARFTDANPSAPLTDFTASIAWGDGSSSAGVVSFSGGRFVVSGTHVFEEGVNIPVAVTINDVGGSSVVVNSSANVSDAPLLATATSFQVTEGTAFTGVVAHFNDTDAVAPVTDFNGTQINWGDGTTSTATVVANSTIGGFDVIGTHSFEEGSFTVTATINDIGGSTATTTYALTVADAALTAAPVALTAQEGISFNSPVATFTDADTNAPVTDYSATITWGDNTTSSGTIVPIGVGTGQYQVKGSHTYEEGVYAISVSIKDVGGSSTLASLSVSVPDGQLSMSPATVSATEGVPFSGVLATFTDANPNAPLTDYSAVIDWRDGTTSAGVIAAQSGGGYTVSGTHTFEAGVFAPNITVIDVGGSTASTSVTFTVLDAPLSKNDVSDLAITEGATITDPVANFSDGNTNAPLTDFSATINWGDGTPVTAGTIAPDGKGNYNVTGAHQYEKGTFTITISVKDVDGATTTATTNIKVSDAPLSAGLTAVSPTEGVPFTAPVATFIDGNPVATAADFTATITWESGATTPGTITALGGGRFAVSGNHTYVDESNPSVSVVITDVDGQSATAAGAIIVQDAPITSAGLIFTATERVAFSGTVASFQDGNPLADSTNFVASIDWGDGVTTAGTISPQGGSKFLVNGTHTYGDSATYVIHISVVDKGGSVATPASAAVVGDLIFPLTGALNPATNTGAANGALATMNRQPNFTGTAEPGAIVHLFAQASGSSGAGVVGQAQADGSGNWSITTIPLGDGAYSFSASATEPTGKPSSNLTALYPNATNGLVVIDTTPPHVANVSLNPSNGQFAITFQDAIDGMVAGEILNPANYSLSLPTGRTARNFSLASLALSATDPNTVIATFNTGRRMRAGGYVLTIESANVKDVAGNTLDERVYTPFPSVNPPAGSNYVAQIVTDGRTASGPQVYVPFSQILAANQHSQFIRSRTGVRIRGRGRR